MVGHEQILGLLWLGPGFVGSSFYEKGIVEICIFLEKVLGIYFAGLITKFDQFNNYLIRHDRKWASRFFFGVNLDLIAHKKICGSWASSWEPLW